MGWVQTPRPGLIWGDLALRGPVPASMPHGPPSRDAPRRIAGSRGFAYAPDGPPSRDPPRGGGRQAAGDARVSYDRGGRGGGGWQGAAGPGSATGQRGEWPCRGKGGAGVEVRERGERKRGRRSLAPVPLRLMRGGGPPGYRRSCGQAAAAAAAAAAVAFLPRTADTVRLRVSVWLCGCVSVCLRPCVRVCDCVCGCVSVSVCRWLRSLLRRCLLTGHNLALAVSGNSQARPPPSLAPRRQPSLELAPDPSRLHVCVCVCQKGGGGGGLSRAPPAGSVPARAVPRSISGRSGGRASTQSDPAPRRTAAAAAAAALYSPPPPYGVSLSAQAGGGRLRG